MRQANALWQYRRHASTRISDGPTDHAPYRGQTPMSGQSPLSRAIGYALLAAGLGAVFLSAIMAGTLSQTRVSEDTQGYDAARLVVFLGLLWIAVAWALWRAGQIKLLVSVIGLAVFGFTLGAFALGDLDAGGSTDSKTDVGLVIGSAGALIGLFVSWGRARLLWPSAARRQ